MPIITRSCAGCTRSFSISEEDQAALKALAPQIAGRTVELSQPTHCVECRQQRRAAVANQLFLYKRTCGLTGESVVTNIHPDTPYTVYKQEAWYSDKWDPLQYGRDFDFSRPFFEQWHELSLAVPRPALFTGYQYDENSEYTNHAGKNKNCYMLFDSDENRDCYYCYSVNGSINCAECFRVRKSELCYGCVDSIKCYNCSFLQECDNCSDSMFLKNCIGCKNCLMCSNLKNKEYYVENKKVTKEEFQRLKNMLTSHSRLASARQRFAKFALEHPQKYMHGVQNENVVGDYVTGSKNAYWCFDSSDLWDCRYIFQGFMPAKNCMDVQECGDAERIYECAFVGYGANTSCFCTHILGDNSNMLYSSYSPHSKECFGCIGLRHKQYCILNKQYTKEQYAELTAKIVEHMKKTGEWGEFFPIKYAYAAYNETLAQDYFPLTKAEVLQRGWRWRDADPKTYAPATAQVPDDIAAVKDDMLHQMLSCASCRKNYRIIAQELVLCRQLGLPLPLECFECRLKQKRSLRNPRQLYDRACGKCKKPVRTTFAPDRPEIVYCESCYQDALQ